MGRYRTPAGTLHVGSVPMSVVMHRALREAIRLGHRFVGPAHIVLALVDEQPPSIAQEGLQASGVDWEREATAK